MPPQQGAYEAVFSASCVAEGFGLPCVKRLQPYRRGAPLEMMAGRKMCAAVRVQGGYFVVNGSEKVLIAQERMANNHVYVFRKVLPGLAAPPKTCCCTAAGTLPECDLLGTCARRC